MSDVDRIDWFLIVVLVFTTIMGFLFGANTVLKVEKPKLEALEAELWRCQRREALHELPAPRQSQDL